MIPALAILFYELPSRPDSHRSGISARDDSSLGGHPRDPQSSQLPPARAVSFRPNFLMRLSLCFFQNVAGRSSSGWNPGFVPGLGLIVGERPKP